MKSINPNNATVPSTEPASVASIPQQKRKKPNRNRRDPLPSTLVLTPLCSTVEDNGIGSSVVTEMKSPLGAVVGSSSRASKAASALSLVMGTTDMEHPRNVLTMTCYPAGANVNKSFQSEYGSKTAFLATKTTNAASASSSSSSLLFPLKPSPIGKKSRKKGHASNPNTNNTTTTSTTITIDDDDGCILYLGRNATTHITNSNISRNVATITCNYNRSSSTSEFRLIALKSSMVSLNGKKKGCVTKHRSGVILKTGDIVSLHDKDKAKHYRYVVDVVVPDCAVPRKGKATKTLSKVRIKSDPGLMENGEDAVLLPRLKDPEYRCGNSSASRCTDAIKHEYEDPFLSQTSSSTTCTTLPGFDEKCAFKLPLAIKDDPRIKEDPAITEDVVLQEGSDLKIQKLSPIKEDPNDSTSSSTASATAHKKKFQTDDDISPLNALHSECASSSSTTTTSATTTTAMTTTTTTTTTSNTKPDAEPVLTSQQIEDQAREKIRQVKRERHTKAIQQQRSTARQHMLDELTCSICMEILVRTHVAHPCGHTFCGPCIEKMDTFLSNGDEGPSNPLFLAFQPKPDPVLKPCPTCRKQITSCKLVRSYDNIIWNMILMGSVFRGSDMEGDLRHFLVRSGRQSTLTPVERDCIFGRHFNGSETRQGRENTVDIDDDDDNDDDEVECQIVKRVKTNPTWQPYPSIQPVDGIFDLTEPLTFDMSQGSNLDDPICL